LRTNVGAGRGSAEPRKARFFAEQKMRPDYVLQGEAFYFDDGCGGLAEIDSVYADVAPEGGVGFEAA
jgi:hypothetical protein